MLEGFIAGNGHMRVCSRADTLMTNSLVLNHQENNFNLDVLTNINSG